MAADGQRCQPQERETGGFPSGELAHNLNNLLGAMVGCASMGLETVSPGSEAEQMLHRIVESGQKAAHLLRQARAGASVEAQPEQADALDVDSSIRPPSPPADLPAWSLGPSTRGNPHVNTAENESSILIVDDAVESLRLLSDMLRRRGYRVRPVHSGEAALQAAGAEPPSLILLDVLMPKMDGYEVCARLKADPRLKDIPVIFLSALEEIPDKVKALQAGGVDYITKPFQMEEVNARVATHLKLHQAQLDLELTNETLRRREAELRVLGGRLLARQDEERRQSSIILHDNFSQELVGLGLEALELGRAMRKLGLSSVPALERLQGRISQLAQEAYAISQEVHPAILEELGLASAVESECQVFSEREGIELRCECDAALPVIPGQVALCFYRVLQDCLSNIAKHARAKTVQVFLTRGPGGLALTVYDDGVGFSPEAARSSAGLGIAGMEQRMQLVQGALSVRSQPGSGTTVEASVPLARAETAAERK